MRRTTLLCPTLLALACGSAPCPEPSYQGAGSDEAWLSLLDAEAKATVDPAKSVAFTTPKDGATLGTAEAPVFAWSSSLVASRGALPAPAFTPPSAWERARALLLPSAWAHLPPVTGPIFFVRIRVPGRSCPVELISTLKSWQLGEEAFGILKGSAGKELTVEALSAYLVQNRVTEGPFKVATPVRFKVAP